MLRKTGIQRLGNDIEGCKQGRIKSVFEHSMNWLVTLFQINLLIPCTMAGWEAQQ
eukprot:m.325562 g.325562  ORF g.325562 m.325562 type:complete len:55 (-) comp16546_c0_seq15:194-358(-)